MHYEIIVRSVFKKRLFTNTINTRVYIAKSIKNIWYHITIFYKQCSCHTQPKTGRRMYCTQYNISLYIFMIKAEYSQMYTIWMLFYLNQNLSYLCVKLHWPCLGWNWEPSGWNGLCQAYTSKRTQDSLLSLSKIPVFSVCRQPFPNTGEAWITPALCIILGQEVEETRTKV